MKKVILFTILAVASSLVGSVSAKSWRVNNLDASANFTTLDAAMAGVTVGDTIYLEGSPNDYTLSNAISKQVVIIGPGYFLDQNENTLVSKSPAMIASNVTILAKGTVLEGITIARTNTNLYIAADDVVIRKCHLYRIYFSDNTASTNLEIANTIITQSYIIDDITVGSNDYGKGGLISNNILGEYGLFRGLRNFDILFNTFTAANPSAFATTGSSNCNIRNNIYRGNSVGSGTNNTYTNNYKASTAEFVAGDSSDKKWQLIATSQGNTASSAGGQCGAFGSSSPYVLSGLANIPHIYDIEAPTSASAASGLSVTVKIGTEK